MLHIIGHETLIPGQFHVVDERFVDMSKTPLMHWQIPFLPKFDNVAGTITVKLFPLDTLKNGKISIGGLSRVQDSSEKF